MNVGTKVRHPKHIDNIKEELEQNQAVQLGLTIR